MTSEKADQSGDEIHTIELPLSEVERVLMALTVYANIRERKGRDELYEEIKDTASKIAKQVEDNAR